MPIVIGEREYKTKKAVKDRCREIIERHGIGAIDNEDDAKFLRGLVSRHAWRNEIEGCGISRFEIQINQPGEGRLASLGFHAIQTNGDDIPFSYHKCITPSTREEDIKAVARQLIVPQITDFYLRSSDKWGFATCELTGERLTRAELDVDHQWPVTFERLFQCWLILTDQSYEAIGISRNVSFTDRRFEKEENNHSWPEFHRRVALLRIIKKTLNTNTLRR